MIDDDLESGCIGCDGNQAHVTDDVGNIQRARDRWDHPQARKVKNE